MRKNDNTGEHEVAPIKRSHEPDSEALPKGNGDERADELQSDKPEMVISDQDERSLEAAQARQFALAAPGGMSHATWLAEQLEGYTGWYSKTGDRFHHLAGTMLIVATTLGLAATILASAPKDTQEHLLIIGLEWHWVVAILAATTTVINGLLPAVARLARDREEGRVQMTRLRQELDVLKGAPTLGAYLGARVVIERIASIERRYGGGTKE